MKWLLISLAIGLVSSEKLDRIYLPPPGAQFAGGNLGNHDAPLEPPHHPHSGPTGHQGSHTNFGINAEPVNFGDKIPKVPTTTTSYAFSQTTTYPPAVNYETTALPINPVTGLPVIVSPGNYPYGPSQVQQNIQNVPGYNQGSTYGISNQPGLVLQASKSAPINYGISDYDGSSNQPINQYQGQNLNTPGGAAQIPASGYQSASQNQGQFQYPADQSNIQQQGFLPTGAPDSQSVRFEQYPGQNVVNPGGVVQIPGGNQGGQQNPSGQAVTGQQENVPSTASPINLQPANQYELNYGGSQGPNSQGTYSGQPINVQNIGQPEPTQRYQNQEPINVGGPQSQYPNGNQNYAASGPQEFGNVYQTGTSPSTTPSYYNGIPSTTPGAQSSTSAYSSVKPVYRPERPQAAADRSAVILNYENVRTPNGYSYSFDTSNGIHADESGIVDNGTKAQGAYSYIGDDGKMYSIIYTADENGFQPRGDHIPTPPPIPEAIQKVIEQAARDKAAGIFDDGSYDETKYGHKKYQGTANRRRPQNKNSNKQSQSNKIKPITGINDAEYDTGIAQDQFDNTLPVTGTRKGSSDKLQAKRPLNQVYGGNKNQNDGNRRISGEEISQVRDFDENGVPVVQKVDQPNNYGTDRKQSSTERRPNGDHHASGLSPMSGDEKEISKYPGSHVNVGDGDYSETEKDVNNNNSDQDIDSDNPSSGDIQDGGINANYDTVTGAPIQDTRKQTSKQREKGNRQPGSSRNKYNQGKESKPQGEVISQEGIVSPSLSDNIKTAINQPSRNEQETQQDQTGYHYETPSSEKNRFPTRFRPQEVSSTMKQDQSRPDYVEGTTRKPFITPNVYKQNSNDNVYKQDNRITDNQSTTRRPFTTVGVTSPSDDSYTDYDDGDYSAEEDDDDRIDSTRRPADKNGVTSRPQSAQTTLRPQYTPDGQRTRVTQKGIATPGNRVENSETKTPGYTYGTTTPIPSHSSRFGNTEAPRKPQQGGPSTTVHGSTTSVGRPISSQPSLGSRPTDYKYMTTRLVPEYTGTNLVPGFSSTGLVPSYGTMSSTPGGSTPQNYYTSTYRPQDYYSTTSVPPTSGSIQSPGSGTSQYEEFHGGYHYGPPKSDYFPTGLNPDRPGSGFFQPSGTSGAFPTTPGTYQTNYQQGLDGFPTTSSPVRPGTFVLSQPGNTAPDPAPIGSYQYQNGPSTTIVSSIPSNIPVFGYPGSSDASSPQGTGYEYGPTRPTYSSPNSPSTIGTTPGSFTGTQGPTQGYSTTYRPGFQTNKDSFVSGPVDGFGRPIPIEQSGSQPGYAHPTIGPVVTAGSNFGGDQTTAYPESYDQSKVVGEDFSGPKQPQRYDPKTGYHY